MAIVDQLSATDQNYDRRPDPARIGTRQEFADALAALRGSAGLGIRDVANLTGIPFSTLGGYYRGKHLPYPTQPDVLPKILAACGVRDACPVREWQEALSRVRDRPADVPYRGLKAFEPQDADWFFGRKRLTAELVKQLTGRHHEGGPLVVIGVSGSGKSSLLRAGLIPALQRGDLDVCGLKNWPWLLCTPGEHPLNELAARLAAKAQTTPADVQRILRSDPRAAADLARRACAGADAGDTSTERGVAGPGPDSRLVVIVDQFEEVFTACSDDAERTAFIAALGAAAGSSPVEPTDTDCDERRPPAALVVLGLRADFYSVALRHADLLPALRSPMVVGPMTEEELRDAIVEPAKKARVGLEDGLVELLLRDLRPAGGPGPHGGLNDRSERSFPVYEAGALPLLSHALNVTWVRLRCRQMTTADYRAAGSIQGAVAQTAEEVYESLTTRQQKIARQLFLRLVHAAEDTADTRRRVSHAELLDSYGHTPSEEPAAVLDQFVNRRLITVDRGHVEIVHDSLLSAWPRLRDWIDADRAGLMISRRLTEDAHSWDDARRDTDRLYRGSQLTLAAEWAGSADSMALPQVARDFLGASLAARRRRAHLSTAAVAVLAILLVFSVTAALVAYHQWQEALHLQRIVTADVLVRDANLARYGDPDLALDLALAAHQLNPTAASIVSLVTTMTRNHGFVPISQSDSGTFYTVAYSPDGRTLATGSFDKKMELWDLTHPDALTPLATLDVHAASVVAVAFSPDGRTLVSGSDDRTAIVWDVTDREHPSRLATLPRHEKPVLAAAFSPDGRTLVTGSGDGTVTLWNIADRARPILLTALPGTDKAGVRTVTFSPDGRTLATGDFDGKAVLWNVTDPANPTRLALLTGHDGVLFTASFSPDGHTLATGSADQSVILWNVTDPANPSQAGRLTDHTGPVVAAVFSPRTPDAGATRHILATGSFDRTVALWDVTDTEHPSPFATVAGHTGEVRAVAFSPDGRTFVTGGSDFRVLRWNVGELGDLANHAIERACETVGGEGLDRREWAEYVHNIDYEPSCP